MSRIIKDDKLNPKKLRSFDYTVYADVERGEKIQKLIKVGEMDYVPGETSYNVGSFDEDVELHRAIVVQDESVKSKKYEPQSFDEEPKELIKQSEPEPLTEPEPEPEPEQPAITEEELEAIRKEAYQKGMADGLSRGIADGEQKARREYEAQKSDYLAKLQETYNSVLAEMDVYKKAVAQLDEELPDMIASMVTDIIGTERKLNDKLVVSITKNSLQHLKEMDKIIFMVNPDDVGTMTDVFPEYETQPDRTVVKGSLKVQTNIGELNFCIQKMLEEFVDRIHEEFSTPEES
ncbi:MAG: FliH/SctL family protein [Deferribacterales bacterium]